MTTPTTDLSIPAASLHILLVDDDPFTHELLGGMLRTLGVTRVSSASDGERGVAALRSGAPDLVICDLHMPGMDGFQVMEAMAAAGYRGCVILLSGMEERVLHSAALMGRFHHLKLLGVVHKPVSREALAELVAQACRGRQ